MKDFSIKPWLLTWLSGFFAFPALLHVLRMSFQFDLLVGGIEIPMVWSTVIIAASWVVSVAFLLAAAQRYSRAADERAEAEKPAEPAEKKHLVKKPLIREYGSEDFSGEDSYIE